MAPYSTNRANVHSFCSYSSSLGSQSSLQPPIPAASTAPPPEYMWVYPDANKPNLKAKFMQELCTFPELFQPFGAQLSKCLDLHPSLTVSCLGLSIRNQSMLFAGNPRYENVPLIGRGSPPPSVSKAEFVSHTIAKLIFYQVLLHSLEIIKESVFEG